MGPPELVERKGVCDPPGTLVVNGIEVKSGGLWSRLSGFISLPSTYFMILGELLSSRCLGLLICKIDMMILAIHLKVFWRNK